MSPLHHVRVDLTHKVVICVHHQYCLLPSGVAAHFSRKHADHTSPTERDEIQSYIDSISHRLHQQYQDIEIPIEPCPVVPSLEVHAGAVGCNYCSHIVAGKESWKSNIKRHLRSHDIYAAPERLSHKASTQWWSQHWHPVLSQRFFSRCPVEGTNCLTLFPVYELSYHASPRPSLSSVDDTSDPIEPTERDSIDPLLCTMESLQAQFFEAEVTIDKEIKTQSNAVPVVDERQTNPYLEHTQFQKCLADISWEVVGNYTTPLRTPQLRYLQDTVKSTTLVYQHTVSTTSRWARIRVMQENAHHVPVSPLFHYQAFDIRHSSTLVKIFTFFYQIWVGGLQRPPTLQITTTQLSAWLALQNHLESLEDEVPDVDLHHTRNHLNQSERLCHDFWLAIIEQTGRVNDFELALVTPLAFIAVDAPGRKFRPAYNFATDLSAVKKLARFAACQKLWDSSVRADQSPRVSEEPGIEPHLATQQIEAEELMREQDALQASIAAQETSNRSANDDFKVWVYQYLTVEYMTPMSWVITTAHYISRFRYGETLDAFVRWNGDRVTVRDVSTTFDDYRAMVWTLYDEAEALLSQLTFTGDPKDLPAIPWSNIRCDPSNDTPGHSPFLPTQNPFKEHRDFVKTKMIEAITNRTHRGTAITALSNIDQVKRYNDAVQAFLQTLFLLVHFTSGQPGRLTEVSSIQIENSHNNGCRNIFLFQDHVALVPRYHKGYNRDKSLKVIYRYLPRQVGELLVHYLSLVRPFYRVVNTLESAAAGPHYYQARSPFLWSDKNGKQYTSSSTFADLMKRTTRRLLGIAICPSLMRHLLIAFGRKNDQKKEGHVQMLTPEELDEFINDVESDARDLQAGHTSNTATAVYALETHHIFRKPYAAPEANLKISRAWHMSLGFADELDHVETAEKAQTAKLAIAKRIESRGSINILQVLKEVMGPGARFRGQQRAVIDSIMRGTPVVSYIAGTGSGKSLCFYLPACCEGYGQTVVITPLIALRNDIISKCSALSLSASVFGQPSFSETDRVILAMPEHLSQSKFVTLVNRRRDMGYLERLVLDEFHYVLLPDHEYRPLLLNIRSLSQFGTPITLLSATVPQREESTAYRMLGVDGTVTKFRESTSRSNVSYQIDVLSQTHAASVEELASYVASMQTRYKKIIVYVAQTGTVMHLAEMLTCSGYHGGMPEKERVRIQEDFHTRREGILIATIAINAGVDFLDVRAVVWLGEPDHPINFLQAAGRSGRDSLLAVARIVVGKGILTFINKCPSGAKQVLEAIIAAGKAKSGCLRVPIDKYADGITSRTCCRTEEEPCSYCASLRGKAPLTDVRTNEPTTPTPTKYDYSTARQPAPVWMDTSAHASTSKLRTTPNQLRAANQTFSSSPTPQRGPMASLFFSSPALNRWAKGSQLAAETVDLNTQEYQTGSGALSPACPVSHKRAPSQGKSVGSKTRSNAHLDRTDPKPAPGITTNTTKHVQGSQI